MEHSASCNISEKLSDVCSCGAEFLPVSTLDDLDALDGDEIVAGYLDWKAGDPEPGPNHGRAYWHGWMNRARDHGAKATDASWHLVHAWLARERARRVA